MRPSRVLTITIVSLVLVASGQVLGSVMAITDMQPQGTNLTGRVLLTSVTAGGLTYSNLVGPNSAADTSSMGASYTRSHPDNPLPNSEASMLGLDLGTSDLGLGNDNIDTGYIAVWFPNAIVGDGNNATAEFFMLEWANGTDKFQLELLTSGPGTGGASPTVAGTQQVLASDYTGLSVLTLNTVLTGTSQYQKVGGVAVNIDDLVAPGTQILGLRVPARDAPGSMVRSGLDPAVFAAAPEPASLLMLVAGLGLLRRRTARAL